MFPKLTSRKINLPWMVTGAANPKGSNRLLMVDKTPLRVKGFTASGT